jgi:hypothetical protein
MTINIEGYARIAFCIKHNELSYKSRWTGLPFDSINSIFSNKKESHYTETWSFIAASKIN